LPDRCDSVALPKIFGEEWEYSMIAALHPALLIRYVRCRSVVELKLSSGGIHALAQGKSGPRTTGLQVHSQASGYMGGDLVLGLTPESNRCRLWTRQCSACCSTSSSKAGGSSIRKATGTSKLCEAGRCGESSIQLPRGQSNPTTDVQGDSLPTQR
jgi:hypothetical protein